MLALVSFATDSSKILSIGTRQYKAADVYDSPGDTVVGRLLFTDRRRDTVGSMTLVYNTL
jgi:hypothetical protein